MIGTPVQATLWRVAYQYRKAEEDPGVAPVQKPKPGLESMIAAQMFGPPPAETPYRQGETFVITADSTGADLLSVVVRAVTAQGVKGTDFSIFGVQRVADTVRGLALLDGGLS
jgi:hypothetical protein